MSLSPSEMEQLTFELQQVLLRFGVVRLEARDKGSILGISEDGKSELSGFYIYLGSEINDDALSLIKPPPN